MRWCPGAADDRLSFTGTDTTFNTLAPLQLPSGTFPVTASVAIYPLQQAGANPYNIADGVMTAAAAVNASTVVNNGQNEGRVQLAAAHRFPFAFMFMRNSVKQLSSEMEEAARVAGASWCARARAPR